MDSPILTKKTKGEEAVEYISKVVAVRMQDTIGYVDHLYQDEKGVDYFGYGFRTALFATLPPEVAFILLQIVLRDKYVECLSRLEWFEAHSKEVQCVITEIVYHMNYEGFINLKPFIKEMIDKKYKAAGAELRNSALVQIVGSDVVAGLANILEDQGKVKIFRTGGKIIDVHGKEISGKLAKK